MEVYVEVRQMQNFWNGDMEKCCRRVEVNGSVMALVLTTADLPDPGNYIFTSDAFMLDGEGNIVPNPNSSDPFDGFPTNWQDIGSNGEGPGHYKFPCAQRTSKLRRAA